MQWLRRPRSPIDPGDVYESDHLSGFSNEGRKLAVQVNQRLATLLDLLMRNAKVNDVGVAPRAAGHADSSQILLDIREKRSRLFVGLSNEPDVNMSRT
jgi:hypothetical protein